VTKGQLLKGSIAFFPTVMLKLSYNKVVGNKHTSLMSEGELALIFKEMLYWLSVI